MILLLQWRTTRRHDALLHQPARWFLRTLRWWPLSAAAFIAAVYALRHGLYAAAGRTYTHAAWSEVVPYEATRFALFYLLFTGVQFGLRSYAAWNAERLRAQQLRALSAQAQLEQLTQQVQPHFLFNALNTISSLVHRDPDRADAMITQLAALLRAATDVSHKPRHPLADELRLLQAYARIMGERFGDRVSLQWQVDETALGCLVPTLGVQPLLENSFRHAVEQRRAPTAITVAAHRHGERLRIEVVDDGPGLKQPPRFGVGLGNLQRRLQVLHGDAARLVLEPAASGKGVRNLVELPCES